MPVTPREDAMAAEWVSLVPSRGNHGRRGVTRAGAAVVGCFTFGVGAGPIPFVTVAVVTLTALWIENLGTEASTASRSIATARTISRSMRRAAPVAPPPAPRWEVVESGGKTHLELRWPRE